MGLFCLPESRRNCQVELYHNFFFLKLYIEDVIVQESSILIIFKKIKFSEGRTPILEITTENQSEIRPVKQLQIFFVNEGPLFCSQNGGYVNRVQYNLSKF